MSQELSTFEQRLLLLVRNLNPFEVVEIRRDGQDVVITVKSTMKERFKRQVLE